MDFDHCQDLPDVEQSLREFWDNIKNIQYVDNPQKLANHQRCIALAGKLEDEWGLPVRIDALPGGSMITLRLFWSSYFSSFNALLGELIGHSNEFSPYPAPEDPSCIILSMCVFHQDRISNGRLLPD